MLNTKWNQVITKEFWSDFAGLPSDITQRAKRAIDRMLQDPWAQELHPEKVQAAEAGVHSCRADDNYRIIWKHIKPNDIVFLLIDKHDAAYRRASRKSFILDKDNIVRVADIIDVGAKPPEALRGITSSPKNQNRLGKLFVGYTDKEILSWGLPVDLLPNIRVLDDVDELGAFETNELLPTTVFDRLLAVALNIVERPVVSDEKLSISLNKNQGGDELYKFLDEDEFKHALEGSMEEWMLFLAPFQRSLTIREYRGPARVRGVAGSGKTVVALHRARFLARKTRGSLKKVLFLTYGNRLPGIISHLFEKLANNSDDINYFECLTVHQLCARLLKDAGLQPKVDADLCQSVLAQAISRASAQYKLSKLFSNSVQFFQDEISYSIKGRRIETLEQYLALDRTGRGTALNPSERQAMYAVYQGYQSQLRMAGKCDFDDFILETLRLFAKGEMPDLPYSHIVVDEIQDLSEAVMCLIRQLVKPQENDLFLVGDGMQRIYPGGYALSKIGIDISGRSTLLRKNYRNTQQILRAAHAITQNVRFDDMENEVSLADEPEYSVRQGELPVLKGFPTPDLELRWVIEEINRLQKDFRYRPGDIALLYRHSLPYKKLITQTLSRNFQIGEITKDPMSYFGNALKYTTFHSSKGLEFKAVFVVGLTDGQLVPKDDWSLEGEELNDYLEREKRLLYVAMTRARDLLYLTYSRGQHSRFLGQIPKEFIRQ